METYQKIVDRLKRAGLTMSKHILDNEASAEFKKLIQANGMEYELVPPGDHRRNIAERLIQTAKAHVIAIMCGISASFPMHLWCRLLPQAEHTLNLLRQSNVTPKVSASSEFVKSPIMGT